MMRSVYQKTLYEKRWFMFGWTLGFMALAVLLASFFPAMRQDGALDSLVANMPAAMQGIIGNLADLSRFDTYVASQLFDIRIPLIAGIMAIILGLNLSVAEEERGELRTILSLPIGRVELLAEKWLAMVSIMVVTLLGLAAGLYVTMPFVDGASIDPAAMLRLLTMTGLVMVTFGTIPFALGMATGRRAAASAVSIAVIIGSFLLSTFAAAVDWLKDFEILSLLHYFPAVEIVKGSIAVTDVAVLLGVTVILLVVATIMFRRRDVA